MSKYNKKRRVIGGSRRFSNLDQLASLRNSESSFLHFFTTTHDIIRILEIGYLRPDRFPYVILSENENISRKEKLLVFDGYSASLIIDKEKLERYYHLWDFQEVYPESYKRRPNLYDDKKIITRKFLKLKDQYIVGVRISKKNYLRSEDSEKQKTAEKINASTLSPKLEQVMNFILNIGVPVVIDYN